MAPKRSARLRTMHVVSAGGVVYRVAEPLPGGRGDVQVVVCERHAPPLSALPKGTPQGAETIEETAIREVMEETGLDVRIQAKIGTVEYWFIRGGVRFHKTVHYFLMTPTGGDTARHDREYDEVRWFPLGEALARLTYPNEREMVRRAAELIGAVLPVRRQHAPRVLRRRSG